MMCDIKMFKCLTCLPWIFKLLNVFFALMTWLPVVVMTSSCNKTPFIVECVVTCCATSIEPIMVFFPSKMHLSSMKTEQDNCIYFLDAQA